MSFHILIKSIFETFFAIKVKVPFNCSKMSNIVMSVENRSSALIGNLYHCISAVLWLGPYGLYASVYIGQDCDIDNRLAVWRLFFVALDLKLLTAFPSVVWSNVFLGKWEFKKLTVACFSPCRQLSGAWELASGWWDKDPGPVCALRSNAQTSAQTRQRVHRTRPEGN